VTFEFISAPFPVTPVPCGAASDDFLVAGWRADGGRCPGEPVDCPGVSALAESRAEFASRSFTFEAWVRWPGDALRLRSGQAGGGYQPETVAEAAGGQWSWRFALDEVGSPVFTWRNDGVESQVRGEIGYDAIVPGAWYHLAASFYDMTYTGIAYAEDYTMAALYVTEAGRAMPRCVGIQQHFRTPGPGPEAPFDVAPFGSEPQGRRQGKPAALAVGRSFADNSPGVMRMGSAAFHRCARTPADYPALGGAPLPEGLSIDGNFEAGSLGRAFAVSPDTIVFSSTPHAHCQNYWYAFRIRGAKGKRISFICPNGNSMMTGAFVSEDALRLGSGQAGATWRRPSAGTRRRGSYGYLGYTALTHEFSSDEALVAACPMVTTMMASDWCDDVARRFGAKVHEIGHSPQGRPLRAVEVGNADAPIIYMQTGQHSMAERVGFHLVTSAFEAAARDEDLLSRTRWIVLPVVNVDSYLVSPRPGDPNMNRAWRETDAHPTTRAVRRFLGAEAGRTGALAAIDFHAGSVWRGHTLLCRAGGECAEFERALADAGLRLIVRHRGRPGAGGPPSPSFGGFAAALPGIKVCYTIELALLAVLTGRGAAPMSVENLREDGVRLYRGFKDWTKANT